MRTLHNASIWAHGAIPAEEWKYRNLKRVVFPFVDFMFFVAGLAAAHYGVPSISEFFPDPVVDSYSYLLSLAAVVCFIGVSFPRLWPLEITGKSILLGLMVGYSLSSFIIATGGSSDRTFGVIVSIVALAPIMWRLSLLGSEWQDRRMFNKGE